MTPELSHRIAAALHALPPDDLSLDDRFRLAEEAQPHDTYAALPKWIRDVVKKGESQ
jgi:hypothetical protein